MKVLTQDQLKIYKQNVRDQGFSIPNVTSTYPNDVDLGIDRAMLKCPVPEYVRNLFEHKG